MIKVGFGFIGGLIVGIYAGDMREAILACFLSIIASIISITAILSLPAMLGIISEAGLSNIFLISVIKKGFLDIVFLFPSMIVCVIVFQLVKEHLYSPSSSRRLMSLVL